MAARGGRPWRGARGALVVRKAKGGRGLLPGFRRVWRWQWRCLRPPACVVWLSFFSWPLCVCVVAAPSFALRRLLHTQGPLCRCPLHDLVDRGGWVLVVRVVCWLRCWGGLLLFLREWLSLLLDRARCVRRRRWVVISFARTW